ncbi:MAG: hypothetical protein E7369_01750 [Clostridiales bacterium]|nr:hypothetical protein [Clostridiales bacterium]
MSGTKAIIERIISDAREKAKEITDKAEYDKALRERADADWEKEYLEGERAMLKKECKDILERKQTLAELDKRKLLLKTKQDVVDKILDTALKILTELPKKEYLKFVIGLIGKYAEDGDQIILSKDKVLSAKDFEGEGICKDKKLSASKDSGDFVGGVMLSNPVCDKDLSFKTLLDESRESLVAQITSELFN